MKNAILYSLRVSDDLFISVLINEDSFLPVNEEFYFWDSEYFNANLKEAQQEGVEGMFVDGVSVTDWISETVDDKSFDTSIISTDETRSDYLYNKLQSKGTRLMKDIENIYALNYHPLILKMKLS